MPFAKVGKDCVTLSFSCCCFVCDPTPPHTATSTFLAFRQVLCFETQRFSANDYVNEHHLQKHSNA